MDRPPVAEKSCSAGWRCGRLLGAGLLAVVLVTALVAASPATSPSGAPIAGSGPPVSAAAASPTGEGIVVDHTDVDGFLALEAADLQAAASLRMLFIDHSVGQNISDGLTCTASASMDAAPSRCRRFEHVSPELSADPAMFRFGSQYDRSLWVYHAGGGSYWGEWPDYVAALLAANDAYDVVIPMPSYLVAPNGGWRPIEQLEAAYPEIVFVYATSSLPRGAAGGTASDETMQQFNAAAREYAIARGKPLLDVADILSHDYRGSPCFDTRDGVEYCQTADRCENLDDDGVAIPAICQNYTSELHGGHLGSVSGGQLRMSQAVWLLMARVASVAAGPTPGPQPSNAAAATPTAGDGATATTLPSAVLPATATATSTGDASATTTPRPGPMRLWLPHAYRH